jgi:adenylate cyclase
MDRRLAAVGRLANGAGAVIVFLFLGFLVPRSGASPDTGLIVRDTVLFVIYMVVSLAAGHVWIQLRPFAMLDRWLREERPATDAERLRALRYPLIWARRGTVPWSVAALLFALVHLPVGRAFAVATGASIVLGGVTAIALQYLLVERVIRPVTARALAGGAPPRRAIPGVAARLTMAWALATGVPLLGSVALEVANLGGADLTRNQLIGASLFLSVLALSVGLAAMLVATRSVADRIGGVQHALERIAGGDLAARTAVDDGGEIGLLQAGFNRMAVDIAERERLRDLFGRHVGRDVARAALADETTTLGGAVREVGVLFVDVVGSTALTSLRPPTEVVALLNTFFRVVVDVVEAQSGLVNKFEGDAALCVFGAPVPVACPAGSALAAARELRRRLGAEITAVTVGIGVSAGQVVAGNIGAEERFEFTVIGEPVIEAARLCELAKRHPQRLLAAEAAIRGADAEEAARWTLGEEVTLRGRATPTRLATLLAAED